MKRTLVIFAVATLCVGGIVTAQQSRTSEKEKACNECCENEKNVSCYVKREGAAYTCEKGFNMCDQEEPTE